MSDDNRMKVLAEDAHLEIKNPKLRDAAIMNDVVKHLGSKLYQELIDYLVDCHRTHQPPAVMEDIAWYYGLESTAQQLMIDVTFLMYPKV